MLRGFLRFDVRAGPEPPGDLSAIVAKRLRACQMPDVQSIEPTKAILNLEDLAGSQ
jgi:hypothetical protein